jgi:predicted RNase H-like nuclease (RuvC/YqgF family)
MSSLETSVDTMRHENERLQSELAKQLQKMTQNEALDKRLEELEKLFKPLNDAGKRQN